MTASTRDEVRLDILRLEYPRVLLSAGALVAAISALNWIEAPESSAWLHAMDGACALVLVGLGLWLLRAHLPGTVLPWVFAAGAAALVLSLVVQVHLSDDPMAFVYVVIALTALGPTTLVWVPFLAVAAASLLGIWVVAVTSPTAHPAEWMIVSLSALLVSAILLRTRMRSIEALAKASDLAQRLAVTDELTGLLNRHGLQAQLPRLLSMSQRLEEPVFALFVDIDGLKIANDRYGHAFGDDVIQLSGQAVQASVRGGDLVARWGGDELVVLGIGHHPAPGDFAHRLDEHVNLSGIDRARWPGHLSVGFAQGDPSTVSVDELIGRADADMYGRRGTR